MLDRPSLSEDSERLRLALDAGRLGTWEYDVRADVMVLSPRFEEILGLAPGQFGGTRAALDAFVHPDDRAELGRARVVALDHDLDILTEYRIVRPDGEVRWVEGRGTLHTDGDEVVGSIGVVMDVTERHHAEAQRETLAARLALQAQVSELLTELDVERRLNALADLIVPSLADCCAIHMSDGDDISLAAVRHTDPEQQPFFRELIETFPVSRDQPYGAGAVLATGEPQLLPSVPDDVLVEVTRDRPESLDGFRALQLRSGYVLPLTSRGRILGALSLARTQDSEWSAADRRVAEQIAVTAAVAIDNAQLYAAEHSARAVAEHNQRRLALLADVTTTLVGTLDLDQVLDALAGLLVPRLAELCTIDVADDERARLAAIRAIDEVLVAPLSEAENLLPRRHNADSAVTRVLRTGAPVLVAEISESYLRERAADDEQLRLWLEIDLRSAVVAPMVARGRVVGAISLFGIGDDGRRFTDDDVDLLVEIGRRAALAIDNATLYGREHSLAEALQRSLLPEIQPLPGLDLAARYLPSSDHAQVGGDWFDAFPLTDGAVGIAVGDAMGHDPRASGAMGQLRSVLRSYAVEDAPPSVVLDKLDRLVQGFAMAQLATVFYGRIEAPAADGTRVMRYCSAGHPPPVLRDRDGTTTLLDAGQSIVIGVPVDAVERPEGTVTLAPGSLLVCYTDGLVEGRRRTFDDGLAALRAAVEALPDGHADSACENILSALVGADRDDDIAVLAVHPLT